LTNQVYSEYKHVLAVLADISRSPLCCHVYRLPIRTALCCHSNATRALIANPPNSAQLGGTPYHSFKFHPGPCSSVGMRPRTDAQTDKHTDARDHYTFRVVYYDSREM